MDKDLILGRLVKNGFDFLEKAIEEIEKYPKFSVIHFHAAVELFLKARLMVEHWTLVISQRQEPDWVKFISGDFQSVSLKGASDRLRKVVRNGLTDQEFTIFEEITKHRNKMIHFYHDVHTEDENKERLQSIVKEQLTGWYFLNQLLAGRWREVFEPWIEDVQRIDKQLRALHVFLQVIYEQIEPDIVSRKTDGYLFQKCPSCDFVAQQHEKVLKEPYKASCLVCGLIEKWLKIECPDCGEEICFANEGFGECDNCRKNFEPEDLAAEIINNGAAHVAAMEGDDSWDLGNCGDCDGYHTVVRVDESRYVCTSCFTTLDAVQFCQWCNEPNTGDMEYSLWSGCNHCEGKAGWEKDD